MAKITIAIGIGFNVPDSPANERVTDRLVRVAGFLAAMAEKEMTVTGDQHHLVDFADALESMVATLRRAIACGGTAGEDPK